MSECGKSKFKILLIGFGLFFLPFLSYAQVALVNINTADSSELQTLNGIGSSYAQRIIDYRTQNGPFQKIEDIMNVSGIKDSIFSKIKDYITVGSIDSPVTTSTSTPTNTDQTTNTNQNSSNNTTTQAGDVSVHYSSVPLSKVIPEIAYKVGAGRSRLGMVGTPIEFRGESNADFNGYTNYKWSFGDGAIGYGHIVSHSYAYPGDYVVVLNAVSPAGQAISRTEVKIIPEDFVISDVSSKRIEIKNNSKYEVNLFGRAIQSEGKTFVFPEDTIIKAGQQISFPDSVTGLHPMNNNDVLMVVIGDSLNKSFVPAVQITEKKSFDQKQIEALRSKAVEIQKELISISNNSGYLASPAMALSSLPSSLVTNSTSTPPKLAHRSFLESLRLFFFGNK